jgi:hypothetical protein
MAVRRRHPRVAHHPGCGLDAIGVDEGTGLAIEAQTLVDYRALPAIDHFGGYRLLPDVEERPIQVAQRGLAGLLPDDLPGRVPRLARILGDSGYDVLDPEVVGDPVVERVFGDRGDRHAAPARQQIVLDPVGEGAEITPLARYGRVFLDGSLPQFGDRRLGEVAEGMFWRRYPPCPASCVL